MGKQLDLQPVEVSQPSVQTSNPTASCRSFGDPIEFRTSAMNLRNVLHEAIDCHSPGWNFFIMRTYSIIFRNGVYLCPSGRVSVWGMGRRDTSELELETFKMRYQKPNTVQGRGAHPGSYLSAFGDRSWSTWDQPPSWSLHFERTSLERYKKSEMLWKGRSVVDGAAVC